MTVEELIEILEEMPRDFEVWLSSDQEGNDFRSANVEGPMKGLKEGYEWHTIHPDDVDDYDEEDLEDIVVIW